MVASKILVPILAWIGQRITLMEMGDDTAASLGIAVEPFRFAAVVLSVLAVAAAVAVAGPIALIALAAPHIARALLGSARVPVITSYVCGGTMLFAADWIAQHLDVGLRTPVGLVTSLLGGMYRVWLLARQP